MVDNISMTKQSLEHIRNAKDDYAKSVYQITSQNIARNYADLNEIISSKTVVDLQSQISRINTYLNNNQITLNRVDFYDVSLGQVLSLMENVRRQMVLGRSPSGSVLALDQIARATLQDLQTTLNTQFEGRYIYSGSKTTTAPVGDILHNSNLFRGEATSNYYRGNEELATARISDGVEVTYGINANAPAFKEFIAAMHEAILAYDQAQILPNGYRLLDEEYLSSAIDRVSDSIILANKLCSNNRNNQVLIRQTKDNLTYVRDSLNDMLSDTLSPKPDEILLKQTNNMDVLQASYKTLNQLSQLSLHRYLN